MQKHDRLNSLYEEYRSKFQGEEIVVGDGNPDCKLLLIGEAPGKEEVRLGKPFVGKAGKNLSEFLEILGIQRQDIYITNSVKYRLSKVDPETGSISNRPPTRHEIEENRQYLLNEIDIINPKYIVTLGNVPLRSIIGEKVAKIGAIHGELQTVEIKGKQYKLFPLYHPASIVYNLSLKDVYLADLEKLKEII